MKVIDKTELALAVIGAKPVISAAVEKVTMAQVHEMEHLTKRIYDDAKAIVNGEAHKVPRPDVNYKTMLNELTEDFNTAQLTAMIASFPQPIEDIKGDFAIKAIQLVKFLLSILPVQTKMTMTGRENIPPSALLVQRFAVVYDVLNEPLRILSHIACGSLLNSQRDAVQLIYPTLSKAVDDAFTVAAENAKGEKKSFQVPPKCAIGWSTWKKLPLVSAQFGQRLQQNHAAAKQRKENASPSTAQPSVAAKEAITSTQQTLYAQQK